MTSKANQEAQRQALLTSLFGRDVPRELSGQLLRTADVAALFQVSERTVSEWARRQRIPSVRTPGGHRRYPAEEIRNLLDETGAVRGDFAGFLPPAAGDGSGAGAVAPAAIDGSGIDGSAVDGADVLGDGQLRRPSPLGDGATGGGLSGG